ncbi:hypothetical protein ACMDCT_15485 [Halomonadaceae bacterium KBTZ08]
MSSPAVADRYVTADFKNAPLVALADLMGLKRYRDEITSSPELYAPILSGIAVFRNLPDPKQRQINRAIIERVPGSHLQAQLRSRVANQSVQPYWYTWSLSDQDLREFYQFSSKTASVTNQVNPLSVPEFTVATVATGAFIMAKGGPQAVASRVAESLTKSELVIAVGQRLGMGQGALTVLSRVSVPALIVIAGLNIMAKNNAGRAKRELAARGLLAYEDL